MMRHNLHLAATLAWLLGVVFSEQCKNMEFSYESNQRIHSRNYPRDYSSYADQCWELLSGDVNIPVTITFREFTTEGCCDKVHLFENTGNDEFTERYKLSGKEGERNSYTLDGLKVTFTSDSSVNKEGWQACVCPGSFDVCDCNWDDNVPEDEDDYYKSTVVSSEQCSNVAVGEDRNQRIHSRNYPSDYNSNEFQCWEVLNGDVRRPITVTFREFNTESCCDKVHIYENTGNGSFSAKYELSGEEAEGNSYTLDGLKIAFSSDSSVNKNGWQACVCPGSFDTCDCYWDDPVLDPDDDSFKPSVVSSDQCSTMVVSRSGSHHRIYSRNYPREYNGNVDQCWEVPSDDMEKSVTITFRDFYTEGCCDKVQLYEHIDNGEFTERYELSGREGEGNSYTLDGLKVTFTSDNAINKDGWQACVCQGSFRTCQCDWDETITEDEDDSSTEHPSGFPFAVVIGAPMTFFVIVIIVIISVVIKKSQRRARLSRGVGTATAMQPVQMTHNAQPPPTYSQPPNQPPNQPYPDPPNQPYPPPNQPYPTQPPNHQQSTPSPPSTSFAGQDSIPDPPSYEEATKYPKYAESDTCT